MNVSMINSNEIFFFSFWSNTASRLHTNKCLDLQKKKPQQPPKQTGRTTIVHNNLPWSLGLGELCK